MRCSSRTTGSVVNPPVELHHLAEVIQSATHRDVEQLVLARHVVVDRRLGDAEPLREVFHARAVEALLDEDINRGCHQACPSRTPADRDDEALTAAIGGDRGCVTW
jgi:hypothetical protein